MTIEDQNLAPVLAYLGPMPGTESESTRRARTPEPVTVDLQRQSLYVARMAAEAKGMTLSEWLSHAAWRQAIIESAEMSAEFYRLHPDEPPGWEEDSLDRIFGEDAA